MCLSVMPARPSTPRQRRRAGKLSEKHLSRYQAGDRGTFLRKPSVKRNVVLADTLRETRAVASLKHVRLLPANRIVGPQFKGKSVLERVDVTTASGTVLHARLLQPKDSSRLYQFYYHHLSPRSRAMFASRPIFHPGHANALEMKARLTRMSVGEYPRGKSEKEINRGKRGDIFRPDFPVRKEIRIKDGKQERVVQRQVLFDPSLNYIIEGPHREIIGFFQIKYLATKPIFGVAIADAYHHQGLGRFGVRVAVDAAKRLGLKKMALTYDPRNEAGKLYAAEGFKPVGKSIVLKGTPEEHEEIAMELELA